MAISEITILQTEKTERKNLNIDKLRKQAIAASKQSLRFHFPKINDVTKLSDFLKNVNPKNTFVHIAMLLLKEQKFQKFKM
jgi:16S rRNA (uracil1498-N3)-methyltransferase